MKINKTGLLFWILFLGSLSGISQQSLSLMDAIQLGLENNYKIRISEKRLDIAQNNNTWGTAGLFPSVTLGLNQNNRFDDLPAPSGEAGRQQYFTNRLAPYVNLNWTLFRGMNVHITKSQLGLLEEFSEGNSTIVVENTIQGIILAYYQVLLDQEKLEILKQVKELSSDRYNYMIYKKELGSAVTYDVIQAENSFLADSTNFLLQELNLRNSRLRLKLLLAVEPEEQFELTEEFRVDNNEFELDSLMNTMLSNNSTIRNQYVNQEILMKDIQLARSNAWPSLSMNTGFDHYNTRLQYIDTDPLYTNSMDFYIGFSLNFNLSNGGNTRRIIQNAKISEEIGKLEIDDMEQSLANLLVNYYELYNIRRQLYQVALVNIESNEINLQVSTEKFRSGAINSFNYRDVQLQYLNAAFRELEAIYNLIDTQVELLRLTGGIVQQLTTSN